MAPESLSPEPAPEGATPSLSDRYTAFIDLIIDNTLKGKVRSKEYVYNQLLKKLKLGAGEIFERCLLTRRQTVDEQLDAQRDELKRAKIERQSKALRTLEDAWSKYQETQQSKTASSDAVSQLTQAPEGDRLAVLAQILDPNQTYVFNHHHIELLAQSLAQVQVSDSNLALVDELHRIAAGLKQGLATYTALQPHLLGWLYENPRAVGFTESNVSTNNPWNYWARHVQRPLPKMLFEAQTRNQSAREIAQHAADLEAWVALMVLLRGMQSGLVEWFDKQPYSAQVGRNLSASTFLAFAIIWCELSEGFRAAQANARLSSACFQVALQILRTFAQRDNFPLYGGVFVSFSGESFRSTIAYLDQPLKAIEKTQEKARILTILGYSQQWAGNHPQAKQLYEEALDLARQAKDQPCEIANLNHLSRLSLGQRNFTEAVNAGQRSLLLARQTGDSLGETNAIANLGYAEVRQLQQQEHVTMLTLEPTVQRLERGLSLADKYSDLLSGLFCCLGLGNAHLMLEQPSAAKPYLERSVTAANRVGSLELQGLSYAALGEVFYQLNQLSEAVVPACLGLYLLEQKAVENQQAANLVSILKGRLDERFKQILQQQRSQIASRIGVEGYDHLLSL
ncbi:MAG: tetratricopeptide repeat protein [Elainellaceae cyanobacterium]